MTMLLRKHKEGSTAVEFALVSMPFIWMLVGMIELAVYFTTASLLADAANVGARMVRTGQLQGAADPATAFAQSVCDRAAIFIPCGDIQYQVTEVPDGDFRTAANMQAVFDEDGNLDNSGVDIGNASSVVIVRLAYRYPFLTPLIGSVMASDPDNTTPILTTIVMKNEPYDA